jgi:Mg2+ and Co2+ transporter CorA
MKLFTIMAFVTFPLALLLDLFSLPTTHIPLIGMTYDWEIIAAGVALLALIMYAYFKERGWI